MEQKKDKSLVYINIALFIALIFLVFAIKQSIFCPVKGAEPAFKAAMPQAVQKEASPEPGYDISKIKSSGLSAGEQPKSLDDVYANFSKEDVGENVPLEWTKINPADKVKFTQGLDKEIAASKEILKSDPDNKKAKNLLAISEMMKKLAATGFTCAPSKSIKKDMAAPQQGKR